MKQSFPQLIEELDPAELARQLIRVDTTSPGGTDSKAATLLVDWAQAYGLEADLQTLSGHQANAVVRFKGAGIGPGLLLCGHLDTVPVQQDEWRHDPFGAVVEEGRVYGRGSADMKSGLASMLVSLAALKRAGIRFSGDIVFAAFAGEVADWAGSRHFLATGGMQNIAWMVVGEPTNLDLVVAHRGVLWLKMDVLGRASHGSVPHLGRNAVTKAAGIIQALENFSLDAPPHPLLPPPSITVSMVSSGERPNFIPSRCTLVLDVRTVPGLTSRDVIRSLTEMAQHAGPVDGYGLEFECLLEQPAVETAITEPLITKARVAARKAGLRAAKIRGVGYYSDAAILQPATGVPTLIFGPGDDRVGQQVDEYVAQSALPAASAFLCQLAFEMFGQSPAASASPLAPSP